jgi:hypothetical protein
MSLLLLPIVAFVVAFATLSLVSSSNHQNIITAWGGEGLSQVFVFSPINTTTCQWKRPLRQQPRKQSDCSVLLNVSVWLSPCESPFSSVVRSLVIFAKGCGFESLLGSHFTWGVISNWLSIVFNDIAKFLMASLMM